MPRLILKKLTAILIVVAVLLVPLHSVAHDMASGTAQGACAGQMLTGDCSVDNSSQQPDQCPGDNRGDCCDSEGYSQDAIAPPFACYLKINSSVKQLFSTDAHSHIPTVYLAIFVPPER